MGFGTAPGNAREAEIERLMTLYENSLLRMCFLYLRDLALAEDAMQDTFIKAYQHMDTFEGRSSEKTWLMRIAINTCKDYRRGTWFRFVDRRVNPDQFPQPVCAVTAQDSALTMQVMQLPVKYREVVLLRYYQGLTAEEIGKALHIAVPTVYARLRKAKQRLRTELEECDHE